MARELLSDADRERIRAAVREAERHSGAEIVPVIVAACGGHRAADWAGTALGALAGALASPWISLARGWAPPSRWLAPLCVVAGALAGALLAQVPALRRALTGRAGLEARVDAMAHLAFVRHEVFRTRDRTGILLLVARFERQVRVLADSAVYRAVPAAVWEKLAAETAAGMSRSSAAEALLGAVRRTGELVGEFGPRRREDDVDELPDEPIEGV